MALRILVTDDIDPEGVALLTAVPEFQVDVVSTLPPAELVKRIGDYDAIVGRSATRISEELLEHAKRLKIIGRAGVGVDNVAVAKATELGIAVINAPAGNTIAVVELFFGMLIGLLRQIPQAAHSMSEGRWDRSKLMGNEVKGRTLGIVGVGRIGTEVAKRAHAFGMEVAGFDPYISDDRFAALRVRRFAELAELLQAADVVTVHTPLNDETRGMIGERELRQLKKGSIVVNMARGGIVDDAALLERLRSGHIRGAVLDVFSNEPLPADHPLRKAPNVLLTPHMGASTYEAQRNVAVDVS
ncbi:MAG: hydroxyacid dehydrogenase, partial [Gemmatimonadaceae bacterium]